MPTDTPARPRALGHLDAPPADASTPQYFGLDSLGANLNLNRVSDDDYWRDFTRTPSLTQRLLSNDAALNWSKGDWSGAARALNYQTLQYAPAPIVPPYDRLPQITANYNKYDWHGFDFSSTPTTRGSEADRVAAAASPTASAPSRWRQLSRPLLTPGSFVTPEAAAARAPPTSSTRRWPTARARASRTVPTFSLDSGLVFERDASFFGRAFRQTLEPRAFYVYTPYRDQSQLPNYDSASNDFNFATDLHRERVLAATTASPTATC